MQTIISKKTISEILDQCKKAYEKGGVNELANSTHKMLLMSKVKFPLVEFFSEEIFKLVNENEQISYLQHIAGFKTMGGNVICGKMLQLRLTRHYAECFEKASDYIITGGEWYSCDLIGERVMGYALLTEPEKTIPMLRNIMEHPVNWVARTVGVAVHYATKKGLQKKYVEEVLLLLLEKSNTTDYHIKTGIGWGAKTVAKFHEDLIQKHRDKIEDPSTKAWFKSKIKMGLATAAYRKEKQVKKLLHTTN